LKGDESFENNCSSSEVAQTPPKHQSHIRSALNKSIDAKRDGCFVRSVTESSIIKRRRNKKQEKANYKTRTKEDVFNFDQDDDDLIFSLELQGTYGSRS
jgi:hypothetical protein